MNQVSLSDVYWFQEGPGVRNWQFKESGIKLLNVANITKQGKIDLDKTDRHLSTEEVDSKYQHFLIDEGDLVIASSGITNDEDNLLRTKIAFIEKQHLPLCLNTSTIRFKAKDGVSDLKFLKHWLNSLEFRQQITKEVTGIAQKNFGPSHLKKIKISLPPLTEQRRIASILDQADELRQKRQQAIEKLDQLLQATFIDMFGDPNTYQNRFPIKSLKQVCTKITDGEHGTVQRLESGKLYLMARNITKNMTLDMTEVSYISEEDHQRIYKRCSPESGDLMIVCVGATIGKLCLVPDMGEFSLARSVALLKPDINSVISQYLLYLLASDYMQQKILNSRNTAAQAGLYLGKLSIIEVPVPPKELQEKWSKIALSIEDQKQNLYKQLDMQNQLFSSLQNQAFSGTL